MDITTSFDRALENKDLPAGVRDQAIQLHGDLDLAWRCAQDVFGDQALPVHAIEIVKLLRIRVANS